MEKLLTSIKHDLVLNGIYSKTPRSNRTNYTIKIDDMGEYYRIDIKFFCPNTKGIVTRAIKSLVDYFRADNYLYTLDANKTNYWTMRSSGMCDGETKNCTKLFIKLYK